MIRFSSSFPLVLALALVACGPKGSPRLEGKWLGTKAEGVDPSQQVLADDFASKTVLEFRGNAVAIRTPKGVQMGHYKVTSGEKEKESVTIVTDSDGDDEQHTFVFEGTETLRWKILPQRTIVLAKQKSDTPASK